MESLFHNTHLCKLPGGLANFKLHLLHVLLRPLNKKGCIFQLCELGTHVSWKNEAGVHGGNHSY